MRKIVMLLTIISLSLFTFGCRKKENTYIAITSQEAKTIMDSESNYIILDVRSLDEYNTGHIQNAIVIPHDEITEKAPNILNDKEQLILVYCRSGRRSKIAAESLVKLGYTNIKEFGGINDWPYEIVK
jgi:rhodanese-related sulfurtransferase